MKTIQFAGLFIISLTFPFYCLSQTGISGDFSYKSTGYFYSESITLSSDGYFCYKLEIHMGYRIYVQGKWYQRGNYLILNDDYSNSRLSLLNNTIKEMYNQKEKCMVFNIRNSYGQTFMYHFYGINNNGDTVVLRDQYEQTRIKDNIEKFWVINTAGLKSPINKINSQVANIIDFIWDEKRHFIDEYWIIINDSTIQPRGLNGELQNHYLIKGIN